MRNKKSVLKILSANSECFRVSAGIAPNKLIGAIFCHNKLNANTLQNATIQNTQLTKRFKTTAKGHKGN